MARQGRIIVNSDEWTLSNPGFTVARDTERFARNLARWMTGGDPGRLHGFSTNHGLAGKRLAQTLRAAGHSWTCAVGGGVSLEALMVYDGIFVAGNAVDNRVLIEYVRAGGSVYLAGGTGWGSAASEARRWNGFLGAFGLKLDEHRNPVSGHLATDAEHPLFDGVGSLFYSHGNEVVASDPDTTAVLMAWRGRGQIAVFDPARSPGAGPVSVSVSGSASGSVSGTVSVSVSGSESGSESDVATVRITHIQYRGKVARTEADEYVEIACEGSGRIDVSGWQLVSSSRRIQDFVFPEDTVLHAGQVIRVYTNEIHPESGGFSYGSRRAVWNNKGGVGLLRNTAGDEVSTFRYGKKGR